MAFAPSNVSIICLCNYLDSIIIDLIELIDMNTISFKAIIFIHLVIIQNVLLIRFPPFIYLGHTFYIFGDPCVTGKGSCTVLCKLFQVYYLK